MVHYHSTTRQCWKGHSLTTAFHLHVISGSLLGFCFLFGISMQSGDIAAKIKEIPEMDWTATAYLSHVYWKQWPQGSINQYFHAICSPKYMYASGHEHLPLTCAVLERLDPWARQTQNEAPMELLTLTKGSEITNTFGAGPILKHRKHWFTKHRGMCFRATDFNKNCPLALSPYWSQWLWSTCLRALWE